jgi:hypothetical protein
MAKASPHPLVRMQHTRNRTPTGKRTVTPARKAAVYFAFGRDARQAEGNQRGEWLGPGGEPHKHEEVLTWAQDQARQHEHTFQALLSVPQARLTGADYARALAATKQIEAWRMVVHNDTDYSHAHVLFFRDQRLPRTQFDRWQAQVQQELIVLEEKRLAEPAHEVEIAAHMTEEVQSWHGPELG